MEPMRAAPRAVLDLSGELSARGIDVFAARLRKLWLHRLSLWEPV